MTVLLDMRRAMAYAGRFRDDRPTLARRASCLAPGSLDMEPLPTRHGVVMRICSLAPCRGMLQAEIDRLRQEAALHRQAAAALRESTLFQAPPTILIDKEQVDPTGQSGGAPAAAESGGYDVRRSLRGSGGALRESAVPPSQPAAPKVRSKPAVRDGAPGHVAGPPPPPPVVVKMQEHDAALKRRRAALEERRRQAEREAVARLQQEVEDHKAHAARIRERMAAGVAAHRDLSTGEGAALAVATTAVSSRRHTFQPPSRRASIDSSTAFVGGDGGGHGSAQPHRASRTAAHGGNQTGQTDVGVTRFRALEAALTHVVGDFSLAGPHDNAPTTVSAQRPASAATTSTSRRTGGELWRGVGLTHF